MTGIYISRIKLSRGYPFGGVDTLIATDTCLNELDQCAEGFNMIQPASTHAHLTQQESDAACGIVAHVRPPAHTPLSKLKSDIAIEDCAILLSAVKARLRLTVSECPSTPADPQLHDTGARVQATVLECVVALDQLHTTLTHELGRRRHLKLEVFDVQNALLQIRTELFGSLHREREFRASAYQLSSGTTAL